MQNKVAIVTGASRGIGKAIAIHLAKNNYDIVISYQNNDALAQDTKIKCEQYNVNALLIKGDLSLDDDCQNLINCAISHFGKVDILINNAGITKDNLILKMNFDEFDKVIKTNLYSAFACCKHVAKTMLRQKSGKIINISSVSAIKGNAGQTNYSSAKAGLIGLTKSLAKELGKKNITVNAIAPGFVETDMTSNFSDEAIEIIKKQIPLNKLGSPDDIAKTVLFLSENDYITGQVIVVDGGLSI